MIRKILVMSMICLSLLTSLPNLSAINEEKKEGSSLDSSWVTIAHPKEGSRHFGMVLLRCKASSDIDYVRFIIKADWKRNGNQYYMGPWAQEIKKPLYQKLWIGPHIPGSQTVTIYATGHQYDYDENGNKTGSHWVVNSPEITIYRRF